MNSVIRDSKKHICNLCEQHIADCNAENIIFGDGKGNDNIIACDAFAKKVPGEIPYKAIIDYLNQKTGSQFRDIEKTRRLIKARYEESKERTAEDFYTVIDNMTVKWLKNPKMNRYLRPETLFGSKFESYRNEKVNLSDAGTVSENGEKAAQTIEEWARERKG